MDKAAAKLTGWNGRNLNQAGRFCITKSVLTSQLMYLLTIQNMTKEVLDELDKIRRRFPWAGDSTLTEEVQSQQGQNINVHAARGPAARPEARFFGPARPAACPGWHGPVGHAG